MDSSVTALNPSVVTPHRHDDRLSLPPFSGSAEELLSEHFRAIQQLPQLSSHLSFVERAAACEGHLAALVAAQQSAETWEAARQAVLQSDDGVAVYFTLLQLVLIDIMTACKAAHSGWVDCGYSNRKDWAIAVIGFVLDQAPVNVPLLSTLVTAPLQVANDLPKHHAVNSMATYCVSMSVWEEFCGQLALLLCGLRKQRIEQAAQDSQQTLTAWARAKQTVRAAVRVLQADDLDCPIKRLADSDARRLCWWVMKRAPAEAREVLDHLDSCGRHEAMQDALHVVLEEQYWKQPFVKSEREDGQLVSVSIRSGVSTASTTASPSLLSPSSTVSLLSPSSPLSPFLTPSRPSCPSPPADPFRLSLHFPPVSVSPLSSTDPLPLTAVVCVDSERVRLANSAPTLASPSSAASQAEARAWQAKLVALQTQMDDLQLENQHMKEEQTRLRARVEEEQQGRQAEAEQRAEEAQQRAEERRRREELERVVRALVSHPRLKAVQSIGEVDAGPQMLASLEDSSSGSAQSRAAASLALLQRIVELEAQVTLLTPMVLTTREQLTEMAAAGPTELDRPRAEEQKEQLAPGSRTDWR